MSEILNYASLLPERQRHIVKRELKHSPLVSLAPKRKKPKRLGRGIAAGQGKTCGHGHKGQKARSGYAYRKGFEGGQTPIYRRLPKRGFKNLFSKDYQIINLQALKNSGLQGELGPALLEEKGLVSQAHGLIKILGAGEAPSALSKLTADAFSKRALKKLEEAACACLVRDLKKEKRENKAKSKK